MSLILMPNKQVRFAFLGVTMKNNDQIGDKN